MIVGRFVEPFGRPLIQAYVSLPRLGIADHLELLFDTGADVSLLTTQSATGLQIDVSRLVDAGRTLGVGGSSRTYLEPALLGFVGSDGRIYGYRLTLRIAQPDPVIAGMPSLLGQDVTDRWSTRYAPRLGVLEADVLDADGVLSTPETERS